MSVIMESKKKAYGCASGEPKKKRKKTMITLSEKGDLLDTLASGESAASVACHYYIYIFI